MFNLIEARRQKVKTIISFGGAFSNHIHATAAACHIEGFSSVGIIRGEIDPNNPTLKFCSEAGMILEPVPRNEYRKKLSSDIVQEIIEKYPDAIVIPEGGTNEYALIGVAQIVDEISLQSGIHPDYLALACGTGGTTAGILSSDKLQSHVISFSALKSDHLRSGINQLTKGKNSDLLTVNTDYHFGGYARWDDTLLTFINEFESETGIPLDHVYNGKAMYGLLDLIRNNYFQSGTKIIYIHTGGLQGKAGLSYMLSKNHI